MCLEPKFFCKCWSTYVKLSHKSFCLSCSSLFIYICVFSLWPEKIKSLCKEILSLLVVCGSVSFNQNKNKMTFSEVLHSNIATLTQLLQTRTFRRLPIYKTLTASMYVRYKFTNRYKYKIQCTYVCPYFTTLKFHLTKNEKHS